MEDVKFADYYENWITTYKAGAIRDVTMQKYQMALNWVRKLAPDLTLSQINRLTYQKLLNDYAKEHERQTTIDFHHLIKASILDAIDEGLMQRDPTRKVVIKGKRPAKKKPKFLSKAELEAMLNTLELGDTPSMDWMILVIAKTGLRYSEALALTPADFDFKNLQLSVTKTWNYKSKEGGFADTKNRSSIRKISIDWKLALQLSELTKNLPEDEPIFVEKGKTAYNSTINGCLARKCKQAKVPVIAVHGLRHTHASILLYEGVSVASVARRLGHSNMSTTQKVYLHVITELENKDNNLIMGALCSL